MGAVEGAWAKEKGQLYRLESFFIDLYFCIGFFLHSFCSTGSASKSLLTATNLMEDVTEVHLNYILSNKNQNKTDDTKKGGISSALTWVHNHHGLAK